MDTLEKIEREIRLNKALPFYADRIKSGARPVIGEGSLRARIMFIGEAPGKNEALSGKPFCGASGKILDSLFESVGIFRRDIYITNIIKDRPPNNRDPMPKEIEAYAPYLDRQIMILKPRLIVTLGRFTMTYIMKRMGLDSKLESISKIHGRTFKAPAFYGGVGIVPLYHPAVAVYNANMKKVLIKDFKAVARFK